MTGNQLIWFLLIGLIAGWLAGKIMRGSGFGLVGDLVVGVLGAFLGAWLFGLLGLTAWGLLGSILVALVGALVLLWVIRLLKPGTAVYGASPKPAVTLRVTGHESRDCTSRDSRPVTRDYFAGMPPLPITLRMPGQDHSSGDFWSWSSFKVAGFLRFDGPEPVLEWEITASTSEVDGFEVREDVEALPPEALAIPLDRVRGVLMKGRWWRPYLKVMARDLTVFQGVPGERHGVVRLYFARAYRPLAQDFADRINTAVAPFTTPVP